MHSSLSSNASRAMGTSVSVDAYVAKFEPRTAGRDHAAIFATIIPCELI